MLKMLFSTAADAPAVREIAASRPSRSSNRIYSDFVHLRGRGHRVRNAIEAVASASEKLAYAFDA